MDVFNDLCNCKNDTEAYNAVDKMNKLLNNNLNVESLEHVSDKNVLNSKPKKNWWNPTLQKIHIDICVAYKNYKASNFSYEFKNKFYQLKKQFRLQKRIMIKLKNDRNLQLINPSWK